MTYPDDIGSLDIVSLQQGYSSGRLTPELVVNAVYDRIANRGKDNVWTNLIPRADAVAVARGLPSRFASPAAAPLYGLPFGVKDNIDVEGIPTTAAWLGSIAVPELTADAVRPLLAAGAICIGKTNLDQFATGLSGARSPYGTPVNPFDPALIPGGSSSGSAVAVASGLVSFAVGSDTAGSGRVPAALTNTVGFKPSRGLVGGRGMLPACSSLDCPSVFALTVADASLVLSVMTGRSMAAAPLPLPLPLAGLAFAIPRWEDLGFAEVSQAAEQYCRLLDELTAAGAKLEQISMAPLFEAGAKLYGGAWVAERYAAVSELVDGAWDDVQPAVLAAILPGREVTAAQVFADQARVAQIRDELAPLFDTCAALLTPTVVTTFTVDEMLADPLARNAELGRFTTYGNLLDLAAIALPAGVDESGLPFGVTLAAPNGSDASLAQLAVSIEGLFDNSLGATGFSRPESLVSAPESSGADDGVLLAVVGAHLTGMPLNGDLVALAAVLDSTTTTSSRYKLFALPNSTPPKPGLLRLGPTDDGGSCIEVEVYRLSAAALGSFMLTVPAPLAIGTVELADGTSVRGFVCEPFGLDGAIDISRHGGWRSYLASTSAQS